MTDSHSGTARRVWTLTRRLGAQAALSLTVMAGLQIAANHGYGIRDLIPDFGPAAARPTEPGRVVAAPVRFDLPVQASSALDHLLPKPTAGVAGPGTAASTATVDSPQASPAPSLAAVVATAPPTAHIAVPTPRPRPAAAARPAAVPPPPEDLPFDLSPRDVEFYAYAALAGDDAPPIPAGGVDGADPEDIALPGSAILRRTAEVTGTAAHVVSGAAARILDVMR